MSSLSRWMRKHWPHAFYRKCACNLVRAIVSQPSSCSTTDIGTVRQRSSNGSSHVVHGPFLRRIAAIIFEPGYATISKSNSLCSFLGGHLKTGHTWTLQNRPTERNQNKSIYTLITAARANIFSNDAQRSLYWPYLGGGHGNAGMRPERRLSGRNSSGRRKSPRKPNLPFWRESDKSQGFGDRVPKFQ
jgi:hypothetical protein